VDKKFSAEVIDFPRYFRWKQVHLPLEAVNTLQHIFWRASTKIDMPSRAPVASTTVGTGSIPGFDVVIGEVHLIHRPQQPSRKSRQSCSLPGR
jgi:hypothetical protein